MVQNAVADDFALPRKVANCLAPSMYCHGNRQQCDVLKLYFSYRPLNGRRTFCVPDMYKNITTWLVAVRAVVDLRLAADDTHRAVGVGAVWGEGGQASQPHGAHRLPAGPGLSQKTLPQPQSCPVEGEQWVEV